MAPLFGTDGIRGKAGQFPLDQETLTRIGAALGAQLGGPILLGEDPRESSLWIRNALRVGLEAAGVEVQPTGVLPTPAVALLTQQGDAVGGVMISASHNPFEDNGVKVFKADGRKLSDEEESRIETQVAGTCPESLDERPKGKTGAAAPAPASPNGDLGLWERRYLDLLGSRFPAVRWLAGRNILLDCANGATSRVAPAMCEALGAKVTTIHSDPDGRNINAGCGAVHPESLLERVRQNGFDLGVAYDGDGDRAMFISPKGRLVDGDAVLFVMARALKRSGGLQPAVVVGTSMTNYNLEQQLRSDGIELIRAEVGDRYVFQQMQAGGAPLGGEPSGHIIFPDFGISGDGLLTTLKLCETLMRLDQTLDEATEGWRPAPQLIRNVRVTVKVPLETLPDVTVEMDAIRSRLDGRGRLVVRYSGTENLLRIMIESDSEAFNTECAESLAHRFEQTLDRMSTGVGSSHAFAPSDAAGKRP